MATKVGFNLCSQIVNVPRYDVKCRYYNTATGCKYGENCWYKHITYCQQSQYDLLIHTTRQTNHILDTVLKILNILQPATKETITATPSESIPPPEPTEMKETEPVHIGPVPQPILRSTPSTPEPLSSPPLRQTTNTDSTPTAQYFSLCQVSPKIITEAKDKFDFIYWVMKQEMETDIDPYDLEQVAYHIYYGGIVDMDINTGYKAVELIYEMMKISNIKYRKLLNQHGLMDL